MNKKRIYQWAMIAYLASFGVTNTQSSRAADMGTGFTFQGKLVLSGVRVTAQCDFEFELCDDPTAVCTKGSASASDVTVTNGLFFVPIDFGAGAINGEARWMSIEVRCPTGGGTYTQLNPRQELTPAPHALALPGLWTQQHTTSPNVIGGHSSNSIATNKFGATIGGGGNSVKPNKVTDNFGTVSGGKGNEATGLLSSVGGGLENIAGDEYSVVSGGSFNEAIQVSDTVSGGSGNTASGQYSTVAGGIQNAASGIFSTVGGGADNFATGKYATIPGGKENEAAGENSFAAGRFAKASFNETFVWNTELAIFAATAPGQFLIRAAGGVGIGTNSPAHPLQVGTDATNGNGAHVTNGGVWTNGSDRNSKRNFEELDKRSILARVVELPVTKWQYKGEDEAIRHIGPMAQDFRAAFGLGGSEKHIGTLDADGVALAAIQGLHQIVKEKDAHIVSLEARLAALEMLVNHELIGKKRGAR